MIKHINHQFVVLHICTQTLSHTQHSREMQEIFRRAHNNKKQYFIEPILIRSELQTRSCLTMVYVQSADFIAFNQSYRRFFCLAEKAGIH